jgi:spectinomycin phosphotransferase
VQEKPNLPNDQIIARLHEAYGLRITQVTFLPLGADFNTAVYRVMAEDGRVYFLKLRRGAFDEITVTLPSFLRDQDIRQVMAPMATQTQQLWTYLAAFHLILYPFVEGKNGFEVDLAPRQWVELGAAIQRIHTVTLPSELLRLLPQESCSPHWREQLTLFLAQVEVSEYDDPAAATLAALFRVRRSEIRHIVERAEELGRELQARALPFVVCHTDIHGWNIMVAVNGDLYIVDWDNPMLAPKERDLMFLVGGVGGIWQKANEAEEALFYQGYGETSVDPIALAYYHYERIVEDMVVTCEQIFLTANGGEDRAEGVLHMVNQFRPNGAVELAYRTDKEQGATDV